MGCDFHHWNFNLWTALLWFMHLLGFPGPYFGNHCHMVFLNTYFVGRISEMLVCTHMTNDVLYDVYTALCGTRLWLMIDGEGVVFVHMVDITHVLTATTQDTCWSTNGRTAWQLTSAHGAIDERLNSVITSPLSSWLRYMQQEWHHGMCNTQGNPLLESFKCVAQLCFFFFF